jgi:anti-anti-sigma regulatory factor
MDNVLQHSESGYGYAMGQIHPGARHIAICIYDSGLGIFNSLRNTAHRPETALDAITIALREGVTRDETMGQGNGMWGLQNIVANNSGILNITSGPAFYRTQSGITNTGCQVPFLNHRNHCTTVDFQVDFEKPISLPDVLGGCQPVNLRIENLEDHRDNIIYPLTSMAAGTGTRRAGAEVRNDVVNIAAETSARIVLDFGGLEVVSSSFADEFVGKLVAKWGIETFQDRFRIVGTNQTVETIINRSVAKRLQQVSEGIANTAHLPPKTPIDDK